MTEAEWLACEEPEPMLLFLSGAGASDRKVRLFGCACVRRVWGDLADDRLRQAVEVAERFADGLATGRQLDAARKKVDRLCEGVGDIIADHGPMAVSPLCGRAAGWFVPAESSGAVAAEARCEGASWEAAHAEEHRAQSAAVRDVFGNPFRPATIAAAFRAPAVVALAQAAYDERIFPGGLLDPARLAVLADALEEAGCSDVEVLGHLRSRGPHVRGCFAVDLLLAKD
jgi:hypothetical protein